MIYFNSLEILSEHPSLPSLEGAAAEMLKIFKNPIFQLMKVPAKIMKYGFSLPFIGNILGRTVRG
jgi:hypothetical protein